MSCGSNCGTENGGCDCGKGKGGCGDCMSCGNRCRDMVVTLVVSQNDWSRWSS